MTGQAAKRTQLDWRLPLYAMLAAIALFVPEVINPNSADVPYLFIVAPGLLVVSISVLIYAAIRKNLSVAVIVVTFWVALALLSAYEIERPVGMRSAIRWWLWSNEYKNEVLVKPAPSNGGLKHIEWDGWGWAGMDTYLYLVFDPTDSLAGAAKSHRPGKFQGIPCEVPLVRRLESHWYSVMFYTDQGWGGCD